MGSSFARAPAILFPLETWHIDVESIKAQKTETKSPPGKTVCALCVHACVSDGGPKIWGTQNEGRVKKKLHQEELMCSVAVFIDEHRACTCHVCQYGVCAWVEILEN